MSVKPLVVIITGLSGSGKSLALRSLEDVGFFCVDNLPVSLIDSFVSTITLNAFTHRVGIGMDIREKGFLHAFGDVIRTVREKSTVEIIFLEAERSILLRRFKETRRPHPLSSETVSLDEAMTSEASLLKDIRKDSDRVIDTSSYTPHQLRNHISSLFRTTASSAAFPINIISFGFKYGIPQDIDLLFDVRFIPNPNFVPSLKELTGIEKPVQDFIYEKPSVQEFLDKTCSLLNFLIPRYLEEGKAYLSIAFGCTGGRHRSPAIGEKVALLIKGNSSEISVIHRDITP